MRHHFRTRARNQAALDSRTPAVTTGRRTIVAVLAVSALLVTTAGAGFAAMQSPAARSVSYFTPPTAPTTSAPTAPPAPTKPTTAPPPAPAPTTPAPPTSRKPSWNSTGAYTPTFSDEFNSTAVDTRKWERGWYGEGITNGVNQNNLNCYDSRQVTQSGGYLRLTVAQRTASCNGGSRKYVSGLVNSRNSFFQKYGSFESRVCLSDANGDGKVDGFPAWWLNGPSSTPWPAHGEIDIVEGIGGGTKASLHSTNYHGGVYSTKRLTGCHNFGAAWKTGSVTFYYDGKALWSHAFSPTMAQSLILNYALRSTEEVIVGSSVRVDWVRVWR